MNPTPAAAAVPAALDALHQWAPIVWLRVSPYAYPTLETVHIVGIALVFGTLWVVDLAILGWLRGLDVRHADQIDPPWVDHDQLRSLAQALLHPAGENRVGIGGIGADDQDHVRIHH